MDFASINAALRRFDRLSNLDDKQLDALARDAQILHADSGSRLLELGCKDPRQLFLLEGELELTAGDGAMHVVRESDNAARGPVSRLRPSRYDVRARTGVRYLLVDQELLKDFGRDDTAMVVEESYSVSEPNEFLDDSASHPLLFDVFNDINLGQVVVPSDPEVAVRVGRSLHPLGDDIGLLSDTLAVCPALTLKVIRAARAGRRNGARVRTTKDAVARLGADKTYALAANCVLRETLRSESPMVRRRLNNWWERSIRASAICRVLARMSERFDPEFAALIGLLHAIAEPVMLAYAERHPDLADAAALDNLLFGNRAELGRILLSMWDLPGELVDAAAMCNHWGYDHPGDADYTDIILVAQWHATIGGGARRRIPPVNEIPAFRRLGLDTPSPRLSLKIVEAASEAITRTDTLLQSW